MFIHNGITCEKVFIEQSQMLFGSFIEENDEIKKNNIIIMFKYISENNIWFFKALEDTKKKLRNDSWIRYAICVTNNIRKYSTHFQLYQKVINIIPIRYCRFCLLYTNNYQKLCNYHIKFITFMKKKNIPLELIIYLLEFVGVRSNNTYNYVVCS